MAGNEQIEDEVLNVSTSNSIAAADYERRRKGFYNFTPTDETIIEYFIKTKVKNENRSFSPYIHDVNIYDYNPHQLAEQFQPSQVYGKENWYFFTSRDRKYPNGDRPNRAAGNGFWKATGVDKVISFKRKDVGLRKALVFYQGKPPKGKKSDWMMHEYRTKTPATNNIERTDPTDMRLDKWILCRIYKKPEKIPNKKSKKEENTERGRNIPQVSQALQIYDTNNNNNNTTSNNTTSNNNDIDVAGNNIHVANMPIYDTSNNNNNNYNNNNTSSSSSDNNDIYVAGNNIQVMNTQIYDNSNNNNNNNNNCYNNEYANVEDTNEPIDLEELYRLIFPDVPSPLIDNHPLDDHYYSSVENVTVNAGHWSLGPTNSAGG